MEFTELDLFVNDYDPEEEYRRRNDEEKKAIAYGQRKLLLTLVQFLTQYLDLEKHPNPIIVYAGAAPGINIRLVTTLFPEVEWHLYDPARFKIKQNSSKKVFVYQDYFTDKTAEYWKSEKDNGKSVYFISDIRTANYMKAKNLDQNEEQIIKDMEMQMRWVEIIQPIQSQLKFRLPYTGGNRPEKMRYLDGLLFKQPYSPQTSTETRLVPHLGEYKEWDCRKYQSQLFYHNVVIREHYTYINPFTLDTQSIDGKELLNDYDSRLETQIWMDYLSFKKAEPNKSNIVSLTRFATADLNKGNKYHDTLSYLREHPRAIKERNLYKTRDDLNSRKYKNNKKHIQKYSKWLKEHILN